MKETSSAANSAPGEEGGGSLTELTSFIIKGHSARRPQTVHVVSLCGSGEREKPCERGRGGEGRGRAGVLSRDKIKVA